VSSFWTFEGNLGARQASSSSEKDQDQPWGELTDPLATNERDAVLKQQEEKTDDEPSHVPAGIAKASGSGSAAGFADLWKSRVQPQTSDATNDRGYGRRGVATR
jgi:hypothetical protein